MWERSLESLSAWIKGRFPFWFALRLSYLTVETSLKVIINECSRELFVHFSELCHPEVRLNYQNGLFLTLKPTSVHKSSFRPFCSVLGMLKSCTVNESCEGSLCVHIWMARHVSFWESITCVLCVRLEMHPRGETSFMEVGASSCSGWNPERVCVMLCYIMGEKGTFALQLGL